MNDIKQNLIDFYLAFCDSQLSDNDFASSQGLERYETRQLIDIGARLSKEQS